MKHLFVPYELAVKLREKGFDEWFTLGIETSVYTKDGKPSTYANLRPYVIETEGYIPRPLYQQVIDWIREKHKTEVLVLGSKSLKTFSWAIKYGNGKVMYQKTFKKHLDTYYEALTKAIEEALKLLE